ncbi:FeoA family protein [Pectinatus brassicae]|uniref:Ferrous iron transport protein A n=1 Tax=Pectinatus brassicae TaxID=862415 RepID=A0A840UTQ4_9FIRM|nr:FeoA domain-containing protein [Pectinatus brassicae]MBB5336204.1 ferrous iron transport protein A [Pectinatus brassicae]
MILSDGKIAHSYIVQDMYLEEDIERRLEMLGMTTGVMLTILNKKRCGAIILKVRGTRFALGRQIAAGIEIGEINNEK